MNAKDNPLPILKARPSELATAALVVGEPARALVAAEYLDNAREVGNYREYLTLTGEYNGVPLTISSHGVGAGGASICFEELIRGGVKTLIRAGTCGAMRKGIKDGDFIIGTGAIREDGVSEKLLPMTFPAIADRQVVQALVAAAKACGRAAPHEGIVLSNGPFYEGMLPSATNSWLKSGLDLAAVEMEFAVLLIVASMRGARAGGLFTSDGNMTDDSDLEVYDPHRTVVKEGTKQMIQVALDALAKLP
jgi:uridine phosphorylase